VCVLIKTSDDHNIDDIRLPDGTSCRAPRGVKTSALLSLTRGRLAAIPIISSEQRCGREYDWQFINVSPFKLTSQLKWSRAFCCVSVECFYLCTLLYIMYLTVKYTKYSCALFSVLQCILCQCIDFIYRICIFVVLFLVFFQFLLLFYVCL